MTQAERNTMASLISEVVTAESILTQTQNLVSEAITRRDAAQKKLDQFIQAIPVSDAPAETPAKRKYIRKAKELLASAPNAAL